MQHKLTSGLSSLSKAAAHPRAALEQAIAESPLPQARDFWHSLRALEAWWPVLIPALLWAFWVHYRRERAAVKAGNGQPPI